MEVTCSLFYSEALYSLVLLFRQTWYPFLRLNVFSHPFQLRFFSCYSIKKGHLRSWCPLCYAQYEVIVMSADLSHYYFIWKMTVGERVFSTSSQPCEIKRCPIPVQWLSGEKSWWKKLIPHSGSVGWTLPVDKLSWAVSLINQNISTPLQDAFWLHRLPCQGKAASILFHLTLLGEKAHSARNQQRIPQKLTSEGLNC